MSHESTFEMMGIVKRTVTDLARRLGYTIVPLWQEETYAGIRQMRRLFDLLAIDFVIDVGGNAGQYRDLLRNRVGYIGRIVTFEPVPHLADALLARAKSDPLWTVENKALGAAVGKLDFNVMMHTELSSFLEPSKESAGFFAGKNVVSKRISVDVTTLDAMQKPIVELYRPNSIYLKIDTQGYEIEVLAGGHALLPSVAALQAEVSFRGIYEGSPDYHDVINYLTARQFVVSGIFPNNEGNFPQTVDMDCFFIRRSLVC